MTFYVNVYQMDQAYGGPEEGGWWYTVAEPVISRIQPSHAFARHVQARLRQEYPRTNDRFSSRRGADDYEVVIETHPARPYPEERPRYE